MIISENFIKLLLRLMDSITYIILHTDGVKQSLREDIQNNLDELHKEIGNGHHIKLG